MGVGESAVVRLPRMDGEDRGCAGFALNDLDFEQNFEILIGNVASDLIAKKVQVMRADGELRCCFGTIATKTGSYDDPAVDCGIAKTGKKGVVVGT